jgi:hypothetical protein
MPSTSAILIARRCPLGQPLMRTCRDQGPLRSPHMATTVAACLGSHVAVAAAAGHAAWLLQPQRAPEGGGSGRHVRWRMVGRPWGQFQGDCRVDRLRSTAAICRFSSARPIMIEERHARDASIARTLRAVVAGEVSRQVWARCPSDHSTYSHCLLASNCRN